MEEYERDYQPIQPRAGVSLRRVLERLLAAIVFLGGLALKFGFVFLKFFGIFVSVAAYALLWGWQFGVGFVLLILVHELGHAFEAKRQGLEVSAPTFIPFFGAFVTIKHAGLSPWRSATIAVAGPIAGGLGAVVCWAIAARTGSNLMYALAYSGFLLNLFNLIPIGFLDGGAIVRAASEAWRMPVIQFEGGVPMRALAPDRRIAVLVTVVYFAVAVALVYGMVATHVPQHRL